MKNKILLTLLGSLLAACSATPRPAPTTEPVTESTALMRAAPSEIDALLGYHQWLRELAPAELAKELAALNTKPKTAQFALKKSMLLILNHGDGDLARAQTLIDGIVKSPEPDALAVKPLAQILASNYAEMRRLSEQSDKLTQQAKENQRRIEKLNQTLEALKAIERTLPERPNGAPPAPVIKGTP